MRAAVSAMLRSGDPSSPVSRQRAIDAVIGSGVPDYNEAMLNADLIRPFDAIRPALTVYSTNPPTASGDNTRPNYLVSQLTTGTFTFTPQSGLGSTAAPFNGTIGDYLQQALSLQANAATSASMSAASVP